MDTISFVKNYLSPSRYVYDLSINGIPFRELIKSSYAKCKAEEVNYPGAFTAGFNISMLTYTQLKEREYLQTIESQYNSKFNQLLLQEKPDIDSKRQSIIVCSECADISCGMITAEVIEVDNKIVWKDFGYQQIYGEVLYKEIFQEIKDLQFDKIEYRNALEELRLGIIADLKTIITFS